MRVGVVVCRIPSTDGSTRIGVLVAAAFLAVGLAAAWVRRPVGYQLAFRDPIRLEPLEALIRGRAADDELGHSVAGAGDVDGDGAADVVIGAPYDGGSGERAGRAILVSGRRREAIREWTGDRALADLGIAVSGAGDVDGDGVPDVILGMEGEIGAGPGRAAVYSGRSGAVLHAFEGEVALDLFGHAVAAADVNRDGHADLLVGAPCTWRKSCAGYARLFSGRDGSILHTFRGERATGDRFGFSVADAGDMNGDGHPELAIGALGDAGNGPHSGRVYVFSGKDGALAWTFDGDGAGHELGHAVAGAGDVDRDGHADLFAGAFLQSGIGYARLYSGKTGAVLTEVRGLEPGDAFGHSVAAGGDLDGDGVPDLAVGAPDATVRGVERVGYLRVFSGASGSVLLHRTGDRELQHFGYGVAFAGDTDGDGRQEVIAGTVVLRDVGSVFLLGN
jgi:hypothetical protein